MTQTEAALKKAFSAFIDRTAGKNSLNPKEKETLLDGMCREASRLKKAGLEDDNVLCRLVMDKVEVNSGVPFLKEESKLPCELYDKVNYMCRKYMDRMARFELDYDYIIDEKAFKTVIICLFEKSPIFRSKVVWSPIAPYWKVSDYNIGMAVTACEPDDLEKAKEEFLIQEIPFDSPVQIKFALFYKNGRTHLCFVWNHMCADGGGFKSLVKAICRNYTRYVESGLAPVEFSAGSRAFEEIYSDMTKEEKKKAKAQLANVSPKDKHFFPFTPEAKTDKPIIIYRKIKPEVFSSAQKKAKAYGATVNDMLIAAYMCALGKIAGIKPDETLSIASAVDLRRYISDPDKLGYTNHVSFIHCSVPQLGRSMSETLEAVSKATKDFKNDPFMGLHGLPLLNIAYKSMIYSQAEPIVKLFYNNPKFSVSNVGAVENYGFEFCGNGPFDAFVAGAAKNKPCAVVTALTINGTLSVGMSIKGSEEDRKTVEVFFEELENALKSL